MSIELWAARLERPLTAAEEKKLLDLLWSWGGAGDME